MTRLAFLGVFLLTMCVFFPIVGWPLGLFWLALLPIGALVWIVRTQTTVSPRGLDLRSMFSSRHIDWEQIKGLSIPKRGYVRAHLHDETEVPLPAVSYDRLRDLVDASGGRVPDPFVQPEPVEAEPDDLGAEESADTAAATPTSQDTGAEADTTETITSQDSTTEAAGPEADTTETTGSETGAARATEPEADTTATGADTNGHRARGRRSR